jgi:DNA-binding Lrp family transcriptional regulator
VLSELTKNGVEEFGKIGINIGLEANAVRYTYLKLVEKKIINKITINMLKLHANATGIIIMEILDKLGFNETKKSLLKNIIKDTDSYINAYLLVGDTTIPHGIIYILPKTRENSLESNVDELRRTINGVKINTLSITGILVGTMCNRLINNKSTQQHKMLNEFYEFRT